MDQHRPGATVTVRAESDGTPVVVVSGEVDYAWCPEVDTAVTAYMVSTPTGRVALDLAGVRFCDSSFLGCLVRLHQAAAGRAVQLRFLATSAWVRRRLQVHGLAALLGVSTDPASPATAEG